MIKSEASDKANIHRIRNKIQAMDLNIKGMDLEQFHKQINFLTTALAAHGMIMPYLMQYFSICCYRWNYFHLELRENQ